MKGSDAQRVEEYGRSGLWGSFERCDWLMADLRRVTSELVKLPTVYFLCPLNLSWRSNRTFDRRSVGKARIRIYFNVPYVKGQWDKGQ